MKKQYLWFILLSILVVSCDLEQVPRSTASNHPVFGSQRGLDLLCVFLLWYFTQSLNESRCNVRLSGS